MRLRLFILFGFALGAMAAWACSLNPQPYPPDNYDAASDATMGASPDGAGGGFDAGSEADGAPTPGDADAEADATTDAAEEAGDASDDGDAGDASDDALDAGFDE